MTMKIEMFGSATTQTVMGRVRLSGKTARKLMREIGIRPVQCKKRRYNSYRKQEGAPEPNILKRDFRSAEVCEKTVGDVTEFQFAGRKGYLPPLIFLFNGKVVSRSVATSSTEVFVNEMFEGVADKVSAWATPVVHTDQGLQYWHRSYKQKAAEIGVMQSMSRKANYQDNAPTKSFFGHLKSEFFYGESFWTVEEFVSALDDYIRWYNNDRIRCDLNSMSPVEYRQHHQAMG